MLACAGPLRMLARATSSSEGSKSGTGGTFRLKGGALEPSGGVVAETSTGAETSARRSEHAQGHANLDADFVEYLSAAASEPRSPAVQPRLMGAVSNKLFPLAFIRLVQQFSEAAQVEDDKSAPKVKRVRNSRGRRFMREMQCNSLLEVGK